MLKHTVMPIATTHTKLLAHQSHTRTHDYIHTPEGHATYKVVVIGKTLGLTFSSDGGKNRRKTVMHSHDKFHVNFLEG
jgi:hypothetical protein